MLAGIRATERGSWGRNRLDRRAGLGRRRLVAGLLGGHAQAAVMGIVGFLVLDLLGLRGDPLAGAGPTAIVLMASALATLSDTDRTLLYLRYVAELPVSEVAMATRSKDSTVTSRLTRARTQLRRVTGRTRPD